MKKMLRIAAALAALLAMTNFIGCKNDDDDDGDETVATVAVEKVEITSTETDEEVGKTITLTAKVSPENATNKTVTWTSSDATVATVKEGVVTGVKAGEATITASAGGKNATVKVTVKVAATSGGETTTIAVTEVKITSTVKEVTAGETITLTAEVSPADATDKTVTWSSSDTAIATVDSTGKVTGVAVGTATITAKAGEKTAAVDVTVKAAVAPSTKVLDVVYDLTKGLPSDFPTKADTVVSADWAAPTAAPETNDITWTWVATSTRKVKNNGGLQVSNGSSAEDMITLSADSDFTVTVTYKFAGAYAADKVRCITVGDKSDSMASDTDRTKEYTLTTTAAKTATIAMNGMKLLKVETKAAN